MNPSQTAGTRTAYFLRAGGLVKRAAHDLQCDDPQLLTPQDIVGWAVRLRSNLRPSSWRQYRSALTYYLACHQQPHGLWTDEAVQEAIATLNRSDCSPCQRGKNAPPRTSSRKKRSITPDELSALEGYLKGQNSRWSVLALLFLQASVISGLRPTEWRHARMESDEAGSSRLVVSNAKNTNGRANGETRTLHLGDLSPSDLKTVANQLEVVRQLTSHPRIGWKRYYNGVRKAMHGASRALWPARSRHITLYSGRHQFSADAKRSGLAKVEVAALMGHGSELTAGRHYGKRRNGNLGFTIRADSEDVSRIQPAQNTARRPRAR